MMNGAGAANGRLAWSLLERDPAAASRTAQLPARRAAPRAAEHIREDAAGQLGLAGVSPDA